MNRSVRCLLVVALAAVPAQHATAQKSASSDLLAQADAITATVAKLRGLRLKRTIKRGLMNREQIRERLLKRIKEEYTDDEVRREELMLKRFGLFPVADNYLEVALKLLTKELAGFYDPFERELYIASWTTLGADAVLAHEIDHALQDQHFDLKRFMLGEKKNADKTLARQAVVEGDGLATMLEFMAAKAGVSTPWAQNGFIANMRPMLESSMAQISGAPLVLREGLAFPYLAGLDFVGYFRKSYGWSRIDAVFAKPPLSTEQILHPQKYKAYEKPVDITAVVPSALAGFKHSYDNVAGEKGLAVFLAAHGVDKKRAERAAAGWGGDRLAVFTPPGKSYSIGAAVGVIHSVWDAEADAIEFFDALSLAIPKLAGGDQVATDAAHIRYRDRAGALVVAERRGSSVVLVVGAPPARADDIRNGVWTGFTVAN